MEINKIKLRIAMVEKGFNFKELSEASGVSRQTLSYINNGKNCSPEVALKIAKALNVPVERLIIGGQKEVI